MPVFCRRYRIDMYGTTTAKVLLESAHHHNPAGDNPTQSALLALPQTSDPDEGVLTTGPTAGCLLKKD